MGLDIFIQNLGYFVITAPARLCTVPGVYRLWTGDPGHQRWHRGPYLAEHEE